MFWPLQNSPVFYTIITYQTIIYNTIIIIPNYNNNNICNVCHSMVPCAVCSANNIVGLIVMRDSNWVVPKKNSKMGENAILGFLCGISKDLVIFFGFFILFHCKPKKNRCGY